MRYLVHCGLLKTDSNSGFLFKIPQSSFIWNSVRNARKEIIQILNRKKHKEICISVTTFLEIYQLEKKTYFEIYQIEKKKHFSCKQRY